MSSLVSTLAFVTISTVGGSINPSIGANSHSDAFPDPFDFIDLHIGTGGDGFGVGGSPPGAQFPFGLIKASPDTCDEFGDAWEWRHYGGYYFRDTHMIGFSHTHMVGSGVQDYGNILLMPMSERLSSFGIKTKSYISGFSKKNETATTPGFYSVFLDKPSVKVTLAACSTSVASYTMVWNTPTSSTSPRTLLFDLGHSLGPGRVNGSGVSIATVCHDGTVSCESHVTGWALMDGSLTGRNGHGVMVYFTATVVGIHVQANGTHVGANADVTGVWSDNGTIVTPSTSGHGKSIGVFLEYGNSVTVNQVNVQIAISFVSIAQAQKNLLAAALPEFGELAKCQTESTKAWNNILSRVKVEVPTNSPTPTASSSSPSSPSPSAPSVWSIELIKFYTALYHMHQAPSTFSESGGAYRGMDGELHQFAPNKVYYSDMSIWDIFRSQLPFFTLFEPQVAGDVVATMLQMNRDGGNLPKWPIASTYSGCMIADHAFLIIVDAVVKGLANTPSTAFNVTEAYVAMKALATTPQPHGGREGLEDYLKYGYVPVGKSYSKEVSLTLAYSYDDWACGVVATYLNLTADAAMFFKRSKTAYTSQFEPQSQLMCPRTQDGIFKCPEFPAVHAWIIEGDNEYCEGDAEEWRWFVPHDVTGLIDLYPSPAVYAAALDKFFEKTLITNETLLPNPFYWAGNEPGIFEPFQFNAAGRADLTQKHSRQVMNNAYSIKPDGMPGNDDFGALSSWYVWAALGLYPQPGKTSYVLGSPVFPSATVRIGDIDSGPVLHIIAHDASPNNIYVSRGTVNGKAIDVANNAFIEHDDIANGGTIELWMVHAAPSW